MRQLLVRLIKLAIDPGAPSAAHWTDEILAFQGDAVLAATPGIRQRIDMAVIWLLSRDAAVRSLERYGVAVPALPADCPLTLEMSVGEDFDPSVAVTAIRAALVR